MQISVFLNSQHFDKKTHLRRTSDSAREKKERSVLLSPMVASDRPLTGQAAIDASEQRKAWLRNHIRHASFAMLLVYFTRFFITLVLFSYSDNSFSIPFSLLVAYCGIVGSQRYVSVFDSVSVLLSLSFFLLSSNLRVFHSLNLKTQSRHFNLFLSELHFLDLGLFYQRVVSS
jgi:hypothetical protein